MLPVIIFQDTTARAVVHVKTRLPSNTRIPPCHIAVPTDDSYLLTSNIQEAREWIGKANFFIG